MEGDRGDEYNGAIFSSCGRYRYRLWRTWGPGHIALFVMLNPSTADEIANDPTVERCCRRAKSWGEFGSVEVCNIFALRSTDPAMLYEVDDPVGIGNDVAIQAAASAVRRKGGIVICAWGGHGALNLRGRRVEDMLRAGGDVHALKLNGDGSPAHPLYLPYALQPLPWIRGGSLVQRVA